jgi:hypothetical protein
MLFGSFKEAKVDRDFEIGFTKTSPEVFELAMRYFITMRITNYIYSFNFLMCVCIFDQNLFSAGLFMEGLLVSKTQKWPCKFTYLLVNG